MVMPKSKPRKTIDDYLALEDERRVELIEGEFYVTPSPTFRHQEIVFNIASALRQFVKTRSLGTVAISPLDVLLPSGDAVQPDILFIASANSSIIRDRIRGVPDLVVEVVSSIAPERDRIVKRDLYAQNGVSEYWIADGESRTVEVFSLEGEEYRERGFYEDGDVLGSPLLAELRLPLAEIFG